MASRDVTKLIERLEVFEEREGVRFEALAAILETMDSGRSEATVRGELHPLAGSTLRNNVRVVVAAYDSSGRIIGTRSEWFRVSEFFGFEVFSIEVPVDVDGVTRIRIYPKDAR